MLPRIFITRPIFDQTLERLKAETEIQINSEDRVLSKDQLMVYLREAHGAITLLTDIVDRKVLEASPKLRVVANFAVGFNNVDADAATALGIAVTNTPGVLTETTADFTWTLLLAAARRVVEGDKFSRSGMFKAWGPKMFLGHDVFGKTLGLVGLGRIGQAVARRARGFDMKVVFYDPGTISEDTVRELRVQRVELDELLRTSDFISLHVPLLQSTRHLLNDRTFAVMKPNCIVVNTSRGPVVDENALARALKTGKIAAAGLDVFEREPAIDPQLLVLENVVLAPHIASASYETRLMMSNMAAENLLAVLKEQHPPNLVNPDVWHRRRKPET